MTRGAGPPAPTDRRFGAKEVWRATERIIDAGVVCDRLGFDSFWLTEHHFQHEGYEVVPNGILVGAVLAERTESVRIGMAFNIVPQWASASFGGGLRDVAQRLGGAAGSSGWAGGRCRVRLRRWGTKIGSFDNPDKAAADELNRRQFDEAMEVIRLALDNESFSFHGEVYGPAAGGHP